jgi:hypothetical protein
MIWNKVCENRPPLEVKVLARWDDGHIEDVEFSDDGEDDIYHFTYDGEVLDAEPTHWMPLPPPPSE